VQAEAEPLDVVRRYHQAWTRKDFEEAGRCLAENLETEVPMNRYDGRDEFLTALSGFGRLVSSVDLLAEFGAEGEAMQLYDMVVEPVGTVRIAEHFTVDGGCITKIRHVHDTAELRAAGFEAERNTT
jgi:hypothetical protein